MCKQNDKSKSAPVDTVKPFVMPALRPFDRKKCDKGEKRFDAWCAETHPSKRFMTPRTITLERMAECSNSEFVKLAKIEFDDNHFACTYQR